MEKISYRLDSFEGPLDLLLTLIQKNKVSIYDIPILEITDQYMEIISSAENTDLDYTGEFLVMASQLLYIKSKMLLPKPEEEEEEDPREDLAARLLLYKKYKEASAELRKNEFATKHMIFRESEKIDFPLPPYSRHHELSELMEAFENILSRRERRRAPDKAAFTGIVGHEKVSVDDMVEKICKRLYGKGKITFDSLFTGNISKPEMVATFLAVLEMIKLAKIHAENDEKTNKLLIVKGSAA
ncbi:MAG: segregation/condensation protein A [Clostridia bacterium]|nr:segregation/condensation protein A [Clostridia bacterium]